MYKNKVNGDVDVLTGYEAGCLGDSLHWQLTAIDLATYYATFS